MDVQCERCKTEYEFDDALVSGRGTTVRCTNCGHQFKVRRAEASEPGADRWVVRTGAGTDLTFLTLRELQRAILAKQVGRGDVLTRGHDPARALGTIAELEPFFEGRTSSRPPPAGGLPVQKLPGPPAVPTRTDSAPPVLPKRTASWGSAPDQAQGGLPPPRRKIDTLRPPTGAAPPPPPSPLAQPTGSVPVQAAPVVAAATPYAFGQAAVVPPPAEDPVTLRRPNTPPPPPAALLETSSPLPPPTAPVRRISYADDELPDPRRPLPSSSRDDLYPVAPRRRVGGWIVAVVLMAAVGVVGWVVAKPYLVAKPANATAQLDPRALGFLTDGERALADGHLDLAQGDFDKASALAEHDLRVLVDEARVAAARADVPWLAMKLLPADAKDLVRATKADLDDRVARARKAADAALAVAPEDVSAVRAHIDALRLAGDRDAARKEVAKIAQAAQPETAYVIAALDLAEPEPLWTTVIDRLRVAAGGEGNAGRARAALVYALAKSGDATGAKTELAKLDAMARPYPLLPQLHAFVDKTPLKVALDGGIAANVPNVDVNALPQKPPPGQPGAAAPGAADNDQPGIPGESTSAMKAAQAAIRKGDWNRARQIYEALVARNPSDSEALAGIGDVSRAQGDNAGAMSAYKRALSVNPSYLPALVGLADTQWASGDRASALRGYKDIVDRFPEGTYPGYVKTRAEGGAPAPAASGAAAGAGSAAGTAPPAPTPTAATSGGAKDGI
ncbi:MAG TPA: tetratricopeptide repeat protein [Polyangiaceae bacterium]